MSDNICGGGSVAPIGLQIQCLRRQQGWSLAELAQRAGTSAPSLHRYEGGWDRFQISTLRKIARALGARLEVRLVPGTFEASQKQPKRLSAQRLVRLLGPLFWEQKLTVAELKRYPEWVVRRVLMFGDRSQVAAVRHYFGARVLRCAADHRAVDPRTRNYWNLMLRAEPSAS